MKNQRSFFSSFAKIGWYTVIISGILITLIPMIWMLVSSLRSNPSIWGSAFPISFKAFIPTPFTIEPYIQIFHKGFGRAFFNTALVASLTIFFGIIITSMSGFVFARMDFPGKAFIFVIVLVSSMIPFEAIAIPLFITIQELNWIDSYQALIVPGVAHGICIILFRQFYKGIPTSFVESAKIDGASWFQIYYKIFLPISKVAIISAGLFLFIFQWLSFLWPLIANPSPEYHVIQVAISRFAMEHGVYWNEQFAAAFISTIIPALIIIKLQKYYIYGVVGTEVKG